MMYRSQYSMILSIPIHLAGTQTDTSFITSVMRAAFKISFQLHQHISPILYAYE